MRTPPNKAQIETDRLYRQALNGDKHAQRELRAISVYPWSREAIEAYERYLPQLQSVMLKNPSYISDFQLRVRRNLYNYEDATVLWYKGFDNDYYLFKVQYNDEAEGYFIVHIYNHTMKVVCNITVEAIDYERAYTKMRPVRPSKTNKGRRSA